MAKVELIMFEEKADITPLFAGFPTGKMIQPDQYPYLAGCKAVPRFGLGEKSLKFGPG
jgi:hypothetical protein